MVAAIFSSATRVYFNGLDLSGYLTDATMDAAVDTAETTTFGKSAKTYIPGIRDNTFSASGHYDPTATAFLEAALVAGSGGVLTYCPGGATTIGDLSWMSSVISTTLTKSANISDVVAFDWEAQTSLAAAYGYVVHPLGTDTNTTTGASYDQTGAASATGWTAHLHVTAVSSGTWTITVEHSTTGVGAWSTLATFTAATGVTQQRLLSASATTSVNRYLRYVATVVGGSTPTITFHLSFSRLLIV